MKNNKAFTLIEMILVVVIIGILASVVARAVFLSRESARYKDGLWRLEQIRDHLIGNENILQSGRRIDFGHFGASAGSWPADLNALSWFWIWPDPFVYANDA